MIYFQEVDDSVTPMGRCDWRLSLIRTPKVVGEGKNEKVYKWEFNKKRVPYARRIFGGERPKAATRDVQPGNAGNDGMACPLRPEPSQEKYVPLALAVKTEGPAQPKKNPSPYRSRKDGVV